MHYIYHGVKTQEGLTVYYQFDSFIGGLNWVTMESIYILATVAVNCFVMISGFFLIEKTNLRWQGIVRIWVQTFFYCLVFLGISLILKKPITAREVIDSILPVHGQMYWFVDIYLGLMLIAPFLSRLALSLSQRQYLVLLALFFCMNFQVFYGDIYGGYNTIVWFTFLFLVSGYIKLYGVPTVFRQYRGAILLSVWVLFVLIALITNLMNGPGAMKFVSSSYHGPIFILSLAVFVYFVYTPMEGGLPNWMVKHVAPFNFGVYLIHAHPVIHEKIWGIIIPNAYTLPMAVHCLVCAMFIYIVCILIDMLRELLFRAVHLPQFTSWISKKLPQLT